MKFVPKAERPKWRETAIDAAEGVALHSLIALLIETKELERRQDDRETTKGGPTPWTRFASPPA